MYVFLYVVTLLMVWSVMRPHEIISGQYVEIRTIMVFFIMVLFTKYLLFMTVAPAFDAWSAWNYRRTSKYLIAPVDQYMPRVSILIPAWNEEVGLVSTIESVLKSAYSNLEIVVVNDGSTDRSDAMMREFVQTYEARRATETLPIDIIYHYQPNGGKGRALNKALSLSTGEICITMDADCLVLPSTVHGYVKYFADRRVMGVAGNVRVGNTSSLIGVIQSLEYVNSFYFKKAESLLNSIYVAGGAAAAFRREVFEKVGNFHPTCITEDMDMTVRVQDAGMKIVYAPEAIVYTEGASQLKSLVKQRTRWRRGRIETLYNYRHLFFDKRPGRSRLLSWLALPLALFSDFQLSLEILFIGFLYFYSYVIGDFSQFLSGIIVIGTLFTVIAMFDDKSLRRWSFFVLAPIAWLLFYIPAYVEYRALMTSIWGFLRKKELKWQKWQRTGIANQVQTTH